MLAVQLNNEKKAGKIIIANGIKNLNLSSKVSGKIIQWSPTRKYPKLKINPIKKLSFKL